MTAPEPEAGSYPTFDDDPARWGLRQPEPVTDAEAEAEAWGGRRPSASYAEWLAEGRQEPEWDSDDSNAYQARVEAGLEAEP